MSKKSDRYARQPAALRAYTGKKRIAASTKIKPAIKPNPAAGLADPALAAAIGAQGGKPLNRSEGFRRDIPPNSNFEGLRDQLNSDRLTGGALGNINPAGNNALSGLAGLTAPAMPPVKPTLSPNAAGGLINNLNSTSGGLGLANQIQNSKSPGLLASLGTPPASIAAQRMQNNPMSPPPGKVIQQVIPPSAPPAAPPSPAAPAPTTVGPAQQMQAQKDQMFPPAPAAPVAPAPMAPPAPIVPKPSQITPPAGVTKSQADIDEEKKKLQAAAGSPV